MSLKIPIIPSGSLTAPKAGKVILFMDTLDLQLKALKSDGTAVNVITASAGGAGTITGPSVSTAGYLAVWNDAAGTELVTGSIKYAPISFLGDLFQAGIQPTGSLDSEKIALAGFDILLSSSRQFILKAGSDEHFFLFGQGSDMHFANQQGFTTFNAIDENGEEVVNLGEDVGFFVSGGLVSGSTVRNIAIFHGSVRVSGALAVGSGSTHISEGEISLGDGAKIALDDGALKLFDQQHMSGSALAQSNLVRRTYVGSAAITANVGELIVRTAPNANSGTVLLPSNPVPGDKVGVTVLGGTFDSDGGSTQNRGCQIRRQGSVHNVGEPAANSTELNDRIHVYSGHHVTLQFVSSSTGDVWGESWVPVASSYNVKEPAYYGTVIIEANTTASVQTYAQPYPPTSDRIIVWDGWAAARDSSNNTNQYRWQAVYLRAATTGIPEEFAFTKYLEAEDDPDLDVSFQVTGTTLNLLFTGAGLTTTDWLHGGTIREANVTGGCFIFGTLVRTPLGWAEVQDLAVGDEVYSWNEETEKIEACKVSKVMEHQVPFVWQLGVGGENLMVTTEHPFYLADKKEWAPVKNLEPGTLVQQFDGAPVKVDSLMTVVGDRSVYNITVDGNHNFFVGNRGFLVHNK